MCLYSPKKKSTLISFNRDCIYDKDRGGGLTEKTLEKQNSKDLLLK